MFTCFDSYSYGYRTKGFIKNLSHSHLDYFSFEGIQRKIFNLFNVRLQILTIVKFDSSPSMK